MKGWWELREEFFEGIDFTPPSNSPGVTLDPEAASFTPPLSSRKERPQSTNLPRNSTIVREPPSRSRRIRRDSDIKNQESKEPTREPKEVKDTKSYLSKLPLVGAINRDSRVKAKKNEARDCSSSGKPKRLSRKK